MSEPMDIQDAFDALTKSQAELQFSFVEFGSFICGWLIGAEIADRDEMAERLDALAEQSGANFARIGGTDPVCNRHLARIAAAVRNSRRGLGVIEGGKRSDSDDGAEGA